MEVAQHNKRLASDVMVGSLGSRFFLGFTLSVRVCKSFSFFLKDSIYFDGPPSRKRSMFVVLVLVERTAFYSF